MSRETMQHLNTQTLIGDVAKRGHAWHYREDLQGTESNHYDGAVPIDDVRRRLFNYTATPRPIMVQLPATLETMTGLDTDGMPYQNVVIDDRQAIVHSDTGHVFGIFSKGYTPHQHQDALLTNVENLLDDTVHIGSAGVLKAGAVGWVSIEVPDNYIVEGVEFRPNLLAVGSHDGSQATTYKRVITNVVCDNTMAMALSERTAQQFKVKHSRYSKMRLTEARDALALLDLTADTASASIREAVQTSVTNAQWFKFLNEITPISPEKGIGQTKAQNKQDSLNRLWNHDERVSPWKNTAWGVVQAVNTYAHHEQTVRNATRAERNMLNAINGTTDKLDTDTMSTLGKILANA